MVTRGRDGLSSNRWLFSPLSRDHKKLVDLARRQAVLSEGSHRGLRPYVAFRHFFSHGYSFHMDPERPAPLVASLGNTYAMFRADVDQSLSKSP